MVIAFQFEPFPYLVTMGVIISLGVLSNSASMFYINRKLKVKPYVKSILKIHTYFMITLLTLCLIGYSFVAFGNYRTLYACTLYLLPALAGLVSSYVFPAAIAIIRYHMAYRIASQRLIQDWFINVVTGIAVILEVSVCIVMFYFTYFRQVPFGPVVEVCYKFPEDFNKGGTPAPPIISLLVAISSLVIGIVFDIAMFRFLRKRRQQTKPNNATASGNSIGQPPLVTYGSNDASSKASIPIQATCLGVVNLVIMLLLLYLLTIGLDQKEIGLYCIYAAGLTCNSIHMPLVLFLTVKSKDKKYIKSSIPTHPSSGGLQFHEESLGERTETEL